MIISEKPALNRKGDFGHEPLPHPITHIRLLEVLPVTDDQDVTIQCRLRCVRLVDFDQCYSALSYTWNHTDESHPIWVNGRWHNVKSNLYDFLYLYRQKLREKAVPTVFLWIDALCLNYADVRERNSQVQIVPNIFQRAKLVLAWLEPVPMPRSAGGGRAGIRRMVDFLGQIKKDLELTPSLSNDQYLGRKYLPDFGRSSTGDTPFSDQWGTVLQLCEHKYWTRLWILLENRFAQNLVFMYEDQIWSWSDFKAPFIFMHYMTKTGQYALNFSRRTEPAMILHSHAAGAVQMRLSLEQPHKIVSSRGDATKYNDFATERWSLLSEREDLSDLLKTHKRKLCFERVDKIYALLGLSNSILTIDYDRSNIELFCAVLLSLRVSLELSFVSLLAHNLGVKAFEYHQGRQSMIKNVTSFAPDPSAQDMVGADCHRVYSVKAIPNRSEVTDIVQARLGLQKLNYHRVVGQQNLDKMQEWTDFPKQSNETPRFYGHAPGTVMPIVDGFDLADTSFRPALFLNPSSRGSKKAIFGMISTDFVQEGDILVTEPNMFSGILIRISGLSKTWLTVVGVILFARRVSVESELSLPFLPQTTTSTIRSAALGDFCELTFPTPFTIAACNDKDHLILRPKDVQVMSLFSGASVFSGRESRATTHSGTTSSSWYRPSSQSTMRPSMSRPPTRGNEKRLTSKSDRLERFMEAINLRKRSKSK